MTICSTTTQLPVSRCKGHYRNVIRTSVGCNTCETRPQQHQSVGWRADKPASLKNACSCVGQPLNALSRRERPVAAVLATCGERRVRAHFSRSCALYLGPTSGAKRSFEDGFCVCPVMDHGDLLCVSAACVMSCSVHVHVPIVRCRVRPRVFPLRVSDIGANGTQSSRRHRRKLARDG
jgi:hypothetical protein